MLPLLAALLPSAIQGVAGLFQSATSGAGAAERGLEKFAKQSPLAKRSKSIDDYYQEALNKYKENPLTTPYYLESVKQANRTTAQQLADAQTRGSALGISDRASRMNLDAKSRALQGSLAQKAQQFSQYGQAAQLQNQQDKYIFDINEMTPYNRQLQLMQMKAQAANERKNAGLGMIGGALGNLALGGVTGAFKGLGGALGGALGGGSGGGGIYNGGTYIGE